MILTTAITLFSSYAQDKKENTAEKQKNKNGQENFNYRIECQYNWTK